MRCNKTYVLVQFYNGNKCIHLYISKQNHSVQFYLYPFIAYNSTFILSQCTILPLSCRSVRFNLYPFIVYNSTFILSQCTILPLSCHSVQFYLFPVIVYDSTQTVNCFSHRNNYYVVSVLRQVLTNVFNKSFLSLLYLKFFFSYLRQ